MIKTHKSKLLVAAATCALILPSAAWAQSTEPAPAAEPQAQPQDDQDEGGLEDIIVVGDRIGTEAVQVGSFRGARQLDVPLTVSVVPKELIEQQQGTTLLDALKNTAGVSVSQISSLVYSNLAIRGIDVENRGNYRLNGALPVINLVGLPLENKERVEALKGASALYYGFTTPSGIINLVTERPTPDQAIELKIFGNSFGQIGGAVDYGNTWGDGVFGARINGVYSRIDAGIDNADGHRSLISGAFDFKPLDNLTVSLDVERIFSKAGEPGIYRLTSRPVATVDNPLPRFPLPALQRNSLNFGPGEWGYTRGEETNVLLGARYKFHPNWELSASYGISDFTRYRHLSYIDFGRPLAGGNYSLTVGNAPQDRFFNTNYRAELAGVIDLGFVKNNILIGASQNIRDRDNPSTINATFTQNLVNPLEFPEVPFALPNYGTNNSRNTRIDDIGYYIFNRASIGEFLDVLGGIRFSQYRESIRFNDVATFEANPTSYSAGVVAKPLKSLSIYATYIEGLETTPAAPTTATNGGQQLPPTQSRQYEAGIKFQPRPGILIQGAYFDIKRDSAFVNGANTYVLDGKQVYKGFEFSATGEISDSISLYATALLLDAKYTEGAPTVLATNAAGVPTYNNNGTCTTVVPAANAAGLRCVAATIVGNRVDNSPKATVSVAAEYRFQSMLEGFSVNGAVYYVGSRPINAPNNTFASAYTVFNLGAGYKTEISGTDTQFRLTWENVGNKRYWATAGADFLAQGTPEVVKLSVTTAF